MLCVICYDIPNDRRRLRVARQLEGIGDRVQGSVFECWLSSQALQQLKARLAGIIDPAEDSLRYYALCGKDVQAIRVQGCGQLSQDVVLWHI